MSPTAKEPERWAMPRWLSFNKLGKNGPFCTEKTRDIQNEMAKHELKNNSLHSRFKQWVKCCECY